MSQEDKGIRFFFLLTVALFLGCSERKNVTERGGDIIDPDKWMLVEEAADPFEDRIFDATCPLRSFGEEYGYFEVETGACNYGTFSQPILIDLYAGESVHLVMWWQELWAATESRGHMALQLDDFLLAEAKPAIPGSGGFIERDVVLSEDIDEGTPVFFHVHNHGYNTWVMAEFVLNEDK